MGQPKLFVCQGSHCRKALRKRRKLQRLIDALPVDVTPVKCQKLCEGPVLGLELDGHFEWFERMGNEKTRQALETLVRDGKVKRALEKRQSKQRSGKLRL